MVNCPSGQHKEMGQIARINARKKFCPNNVIPIYEAYYKRILSES